MAADPGAVPKPSITAAVDVFLAANAGIADRTELTLKYIQEPSADVGSSQLLQAEIVYLYFQGKRCPLYCTWPAQSRGTRGIGVGTSRVRTSHA